MAGFTCAFSRADVVEIKSDLEAMIKSRGYCLVEFAAMCLRPTPSNAPHKFSSHEIKLRGDEKIKK